jgi:hypothetical protein
MSELVYLHPDAVEAIARRTVELLREQTQPADRLLTAKQVAALFSVKVGWVYENADRLGGVRIGDGPKARKRFDPARSDLLRAAIDGAPARLTAPRSCTTKRAARRSRRAANGLTAAGNPLLPDPNTGGV